MDGNNRWSNKNDISLFETYKLGANKLFKLSNHLFNKKNISTVSAFTFSVNNQKRSKKIISIINKLLNYYLDDILNNQSFNFRIKFFGDISYFSKEIQKQITSIEKININSSYSLNIFLNYGGQEEIANMVNYFRGSNKIVTKKEVDNFFNRKYKPPELLIRTGGFKRISNFILYQLSFTELVFINKLWPDFVISDLNKIISNYKNIERKFGG